MKTFTCFSCGLRFETTTKEQEAVDEATQNGFSLGDTFVNVCDRCYKRFMSRVAGLKMGVGKRPDSPSVRKDLPATLGSMHALTGRGHLNRRGAKVERTDD